MKIRSFRHPRGFTAVVLGVLAGLVAGTVVSATGASAGTRYTEKFTGRVADAYWLQIDELAGGFVAYRNGYLSAEETSKGRGNVWMSIFDVICPEGVDPYDGGHGTEHDEPGPDDEQCTYGFREGFAQNQSFTMDKKLTQAHLGGRVTIYDHEGNSASPALDVTWTGDGSLNTSRSSYTFHGEFGSFTYRDRSTSRNATVDGTIGSMGFHPDRSGGSIYSFRGMSRGTTG